MITGFRLVDINQYIQRQGFDYDTSPPEWRRTNTKESIQPVRSLLVGLPTNNMVHPSIIIIIVIIISGSRRVDLDKKEHMLNVPNQ